MSGHLNLNLDSDFWQSGAFIRRPDGAVQIWVGPWIDLTKSKNLAEGYSVARQDFFATDAQFLKSKTPAQLYTVEEVLAALPPEEPAWSLSDFKGPFLEKFAQGFTSIMSRIQRGEIDKAVPMASLYSEKMATKKDRATWMRKFLQAPSPLVPVGFWRDDAGVMGATPEILFHRRGRQVETMALAGTLVKKSGADLGKMINDFLRDPKERHEHELVVKDIAKQLERWGRVTLSEIRPMELPTLVNLCTPIHLTIQRDEIPAEEWDANLVKALHPTPALGVSPRSYGFQWMSELPGQEDRGAFGAPLLFHLQGQGLTTESICLVLIRSLFWNAKGVRLSAGCGEVAASQVQSEWNELQRKLESTQRLLGWR